MKTELTVICMDRLEAKIATLNRRARRLGCGEATLRVLSRQQQERSVYENLHGD